METIRSNCLQSLSSNWRLKAGLGCIAAIDALAITIIFFMIEAYPFPSIDMKTLYLGNSITFLLLNPILIKTVYRAQELSRCKPQAKKVMKSHEEVAAHLHQQANDVLEHLKLPSIVEPIGKIHFTGSYALELMTWKDIDMQLEVNANVSSSQALMHIANAFAHERNFVKAQIVNFADNYKPHWPRGYSLTIQMNLPEQGGVWKFDIWVLKKEDFEQNQSLIKQLKATMTPESRSLILNIKHELMQSFGRVPKMASHWLYQAVLIHKLTKKAAIRDFLSEKGVVLDKD